MDIKVVKFGGSSLADAEHFRQVAAIVRADPTRRYVVVSAPGKRHAQDTKVTDMLYHCYEMAHNREDITAYFRQIADRYQAIIRELGMSFDMSGELDYVRDSIQHHTGRDFAASRGEYLNAIILAKYLGFDFIDAESVIFFKDNGLFDDEKTNEMMREELKKHTRAVIPGFYGVMPNGTIKTFSRGGSDITGSIVARACEAALYENWTDVSGCLMADPRIVPDPRPIRTVTYRELRELSYMGATVLHEDSIFPVRKAHIPINVRNTNAPDEPGTMVVPDSYLQYYRREGILTGVAGRRGFTVITVFKDNMHNEIGFGYRLLRVLDRYNISFEHVPSGIDTMSLVVADVNLQDHLEAVLREIRRDCNPQTVELQSNMALIATVGKGMVRNVGTAARLFNALYEAGINVRMIDQGSSEMNIIVGVESDDFENAVRAIYAAFA